MEFILDSYPLGELVTECDASDDEWQVDDVIAAVTRMMKRNKTGKWYSEVKNFGWRSIDGMKHFIASDGQSLLSQILPDTDCSFRIYKYGKNGIAVNNVHHDSPMWDVEWYYIVPDTRIVQKQLKEANEAEYK